MTLHARVQRQQPDVNQATQQFGHMRTIVPPRRETQWSCVAVAVANAALPTPTRRQPKPTCRERETRKHHHSPATMVTDHCKYQESRCGYHRNNNNNRMMTGSDPTLQRACTWHHKWQCPSCTSGHGRQGREDRRYGTLGPRCQEIEQFGA